MRPGLTIWTLSLTLALPVLTGTARAGDSWEAVSNRDGVVVYTKDLSGSDVISVRGETVLDATAEDIAEVMKNNAIAHEWMPMVVEKRDLKAVSMTERIEYTHLRMPWPITDRYFINLGRAESLPNGVIRLSVTSVEKPNPSWLEADKVLGLLKYSEFLLTPEGDGQRTRITLEVNSDPKGLIPKFLVNMVQKNWPRDFLVGLRQQLERRGKLHSAPLAH